MKQIISKQIIAQVFNINSRIHFESILCFDFEISPKEFQIFIDRLIQEIKDSIQIGGIHRIKNDKYQLFSTHSIIMSEIEVKKSNSIVLKFSLLNSRSGNILKEVSRHRTDFRINVQLEVTKRNNHYKNLKLVNFNFVI